MIFPLAALAEGFVDRGQLVSNFLKRSQASRTEQSIPQTRRCLVNSSP